MENKLQQPRNIFEQILYGQLAVNDNVVALAKNVEVLNERIDDIMSVFAAQLEVVPETRRNENEKTVLND